jgi:hypothetical protein
MHRRLGHRFLQLVRASEASPGSVAHKKENIVGAERQHDRAWLDLPASEPGRRAFRLFIIITCSLLMNTKNRRINQGGQGFSRALVKDIRSKTIF